MSPHAVVATGIGAIGPWGGGVEGLARASARSLCGVPVPCAFTKSISAASVSASASACEIAAEAPIPSGCGAVM